MPDLSVDVTAAGVDRVGDGAPAGNLQVVKEPRDSRDAVSFEIRGDAFGYDKAAWCGALGVVGNGERVGSPEAVWDIEIQGGAAVAGHGGHNYAV